MIMFRPVHSVFRVKSSFRDFAMVLPAWRRFNARREITQRVEIRFYSINFMLSCQPQ
jgi:hypothetical protein